LQRLLFRNFWFGGKFPHVFRYFHAAEVRTAHGASAFVEATAGQENAPRKVMGSAINPTTMTDSPHSHNSKYNGLRPSLASSLVANAQVESKEKEIQMPLEMDSAPARGFALHPGDAGRGGAIHQSSVDAADVDRAGRRDVLEHAEASAPLPLDRFAADS